TTPTKTATATPPSASKALSRKEMARLAATSTPFYLIPPVKTEPQSRSHSHSHSHSSAESQTHTRSSLHTHARSPAPLPASASPSVRAPRPARSLLPQPARPARRCETYQYHSRALRRACAPHAPSHSHSHAHSHTPAKIEPRTQPRQCERRRSPHRRL